MSCYFIYIPAVNLPFTFSISHDKSLLASKSSYRTSTILVRELLSSSCCDEKSEVMSVVASSIELRSYLCSILKASGTKLGWHSLGYPLSPFFLKRLK